MSQKYTWSELEIVKSNRECMIGLLEDMHILFDGFPPRQTNNYFENGPHIGRIYDHINRKQFYFCKQNEDTFDFVENKDNKAKWKNNEIKDFNCKAKKKFGCDLNQERNDSRDLEGEFSEKESDIFLKFNNNQDKVLNTERLFRKHENVPSIINNQIGKDVWSPIAKAKERQYIVDISPKRNEETNSKVELTKAKDEYNQIKSLLCKELD